MLVVSCGPAPTEERGPEAERQAGAESVPPPAHEIAPEPAPEPSPEPQRARGPWTEERTLESAAYDEPGAPSVVVHAPPAFDPARPLRLVVFLHGWSGCARVLVGAGPTACKDGARALPGWDLAGRFDEAGTDALLVVPQLAFLQRTGHPGRFLERGRFESFVRELLVALAPQLGPGRTPAEIESVTLLAHSAGFETALAILARGELDVRSVVLFDALYAGVEPLGEWALAGADRKLVSLYTGDGRTARQSRRLAQRMQAGLDDAAIAFDREGSLPSLVRDARVVIARSPAPHGEVPARHIPELLSPLGLSARQ